MILLKGTHVRIVLEDGGSLRFAPSYGLMHDPDGKAWPRCSLLVGPYLVSERRLEPTPAMRAYFGRRAIVYDGRVDLPPRPLRDWRLLGLASKGRIYYWRGGTRYPGPFRHRFNRGWAAVLLGDKRVQVYRRGRFVRLEMPDGCTIDDRGLVRP